MLRAIIFDFDGVITDTEPLHCAVFQKVLGSLGLSVSTHEYYSHYIGFDDKGCFEAVLQAHRRPVSRAIIDELVAQKASAFMEELQTHLTLYRGVDTFIRQAASQYPLAIASGALRHEIEYVLKEAGLQAVFSHITSAENVTRGKPAPEGFLHALNSLNAVSLLRTPFTAAECLVIEDSIPGIQAAQAAGMKVLAVANTHALQDLTSAEWATPSLEGINLETLATQFDASGPTGALHS